MHAPGGMRSQQGRRRVAKAPSTETTGTTTAGTTTTSAYDSETTTTTGASGEPRAPPKVRPKAGASTFEGGIQPGHEVDTKKHSYTVYREIARGRMSRVFEVVRTKDSKRLALKVHVAQDPSKAQLLRREAHLYNELTALAKNEKLAANVQRFFNLHDYGETPDGQFLFLTLGGDSLASLISEEKVPDYQSALDMACQMLECIEQLHLFGFMHCRVRAQSFVTGRRADERCRLSIVNMSMCRMANPTRPEAAVGKTAAGTTDRHAPRCQHTGTPYNRKDDLESWFLICCDLFHPLFLPWPRDKKQSSNQLAEHKDRLMNGELSGRYTVMPKPWQAIAGAINETDWQPLNYYFFKDCLEAEAKAKSCIFGRPWEFRPAADLCPVPETGTMARLDQSSKKKMRSPAPNSFGANVSRVILPEPVGGQRFEGKDDVAIILPGQRPPPAPLNNNNNSAPRKQTRTASSAGSVVVSMSDVSSTKSKSKSTTATPIQPPSASDANDATETKSESCADLTDDDTSHRVSVATKAVGRPQEPSVFGTGWDGTTTAVPKPTPSNSSITTATSLRNMPAPTPTTSQSSVSRPLLSNDPSVFGTGWDGTTTAVQTNARAIAAKNAAEAKKTNGGGAVAPGRPKSTDPLVFGTGWDGTTTAQSTSERRKAQAVSVASSSSSSVNTKLEKLSACTAKSIAAADGEDSEESETENSEVPETAVVVAPAAKKTAAPPTSAPQPAAPKVIPPAPPSAEKVSSVYMVAPGMAPSTGQFVQKTPTPPPTLPPAPKAAPNSDADSRPAHVHKPAPRKHVHRKI